MLNSTNWNRLQSEKFVTSGVWTHDLPISSRTLCQLSYRNRQNHGICSDSFWNPAFRAMVFDSTQSLSKPTFYKPNTLNRMTFGWRHHTVRSLRRWVNNVSEHVLHVPGIVPLAEIIRSTAPREPLMDSWSFHSFTEMPQTQWLLLE